MRSDAPAGARSAHAFEGGHLVETIIGLALIIIAGLLMAGIIRTVQANMGRG